MNQFSSPERRRTSDGIQPRVAGGPRPIQLRKEVPPAPPPAPPITITEEAKQEIARVAESAEQFFEKKRERGEEGIILTDSAAPPPVAITPAGKTAGTPSRLRSGFRVGSGIALASLLLGILISTVFARATVVVEPKTESISMPETAITLDTSVTQRVENQRVVPAEFLQFSQKYRQEFDATGQQLIEERSHNRVQIFNRYSSTPQRLVEHTRFLTDSGMLLRLAQTVVVPGAKIVEGKIVPQSLETELVADRPGAEGNLNGEIHLTIPGFKGSPKYDGFYAVAPEGFSGGFRGQARVVTKDDLQRSEETVSKILYNQLKEEVTRKIPPEFKTIDALREIQILDVKAPQERSRQDRFPIEASAAARVFIFRESDVAGITKNLLRQRIENGKELVDPSLRLTYQVRSIDYAKQQSELTVGGSAQIRAQIPASELIQLVRGKKEGSIRELIKSRSEVADVQVSLFPPWLSSAPNRTDQIRILAKNP